ncbi:hypothetical protein BGW80DRAFT_1255515 [Lactifluus volemus]|nr:hypothetical protein BGW80DRAFT_1255515 [Lactifluus volemus]
MSAEIDGHVLKWTFEALDEDHELEQFFEAIPAFFAGIIASVRERDGRWKVLVMDQLQISEDVLEDYLAHGDSVLLANWIHITRQFFRFYYQFHWIPDLLEKIQSIISKFDIRNTLPGLQHDFCALWNKLRNKESLLTNDILRPNRHLFIALHQGTDAVPTAFDASTDDSDPILRWSPSYPLFSTSRYWKQRFVTTLPDPALSIATETHAAAPAISPMDNSESDTRPAMAASTAISPSFSSSGAVDRLYKIGDPPSVVPGIPPSSSPVPVFSDMLPSDPLMSSARSPTSQIELIAPSSRLLTLGSIPEICFTSPQVTSDSQSLANLSENDATIDNSLATDLAQPEHLVDTTPARDADRPHHTLSGMYFEIAHLYVSLTRHGLPISLPYQFLLYNSSLSFCAFSVCNNFAQNPRLCAKMKANEREWIGLKVLI